MPCRCRLGQIRRSLAQPACGNTEEGSQSNIAGKSEKYSPTGGAIWTSADSTTTIKNTSFKNNSAKHSGGAIKDYGVINGSGLSFVGNSSNNGGAIYQTANSAVSLDKSVFYNNTAGAGGAIYMEENASLTLKNSIFSGNNTIGNPADFGGQGSAIYIRNGSSLNLDNVYFTDNTNPNSFGTLNNNGGILKANNATFINNGTINVTGLVKQQIAMTNNGAITIAKGAEYRADGTNGVITNESSTTEVMGKIFNHGIFATSNSGTIKNYGYIENMEGGTENMTYITENQTTSANFKTPYSAGNKYGTIVLKDANDNISVSNATSTGFIKYTYPADAPDVYETPAVCKYNYLIVDNRDIDFTGTGLKGEFAHIKFLEIRSEDPKIPVITQPDNIGGSRLNSLQGFIVKGKANVKENNRLVAEAAYIEGTFYYGGLFCISGNINVVPSTQNTYFGNSSADCLVKY